MKALLSQLQTDTLVDPNSALHRRLARFNRRRACPSTSDARWEDSLREDLQLQLQEGRFIETERRNLQAMLAAVPDDAEAFMLWFENLKQTGPGQNDPLFDWLASKASLSEMRWFLEQEVAGEAGFDDLVALTQLRMPKQPKLEMARNYWDEMGRGREVRMHGPMLERVSDELQLTPRIDHIVWEALALANLMQGLATTRRYAYQSVGALGVVELTAPTRVSRVARGLKRLGVSHHARSYFVLHSSIDVKHSQAWNREIIAPLIDKQPEVQQAIAEGALLRLSAGARCFRRYREFLMPGASTSRPQRELRQAGASPLRLPAPSGRQA